MNLFTRPQLEVFARSKPAVLSLAVLLGLLAAAGTVSAHAGRVDSTPADGAVLDNPPEHILITFSEPVEPEFSKVELEGPDGQSVTIGETTVEGNVVKASVPDTLAAGIHLVHWKVLSVDGHRVDGSFSFRLRESAAPEPAPSTDTDPVVDAPTAAPTVVDEAGDQTIRSDEPTVDGARNFPRTMIMAVVGVLALALGGVAARARRNR